MLKAIGCLLIILACAGAGRMGAKESRSRQKVLAGAAQGLLALMRQMAYAVPISKALQEAGNGAAEANWLFNGTAYLLSKGQGITAEEAWRQNLDSRQLAEEDHQLLLLIGSGLGLSDNEDQQRNLKMIQQKIIQAETKAARQAEEQGRIWKTMGWSCGAVLSMLLL